MSAPACDYEMIHMSIHVGILSVTFGSPLSTSLRLASGCEPSASLILLTTTVLMVKESSVGFAETSKHKIKLIKFRCNKLSSFLNFLTLPINPSMN